MSIVVFAGEQYPGVLDSLIGASHFRAGHRRLVGVGISFGDSREPGRSAAQWIWQSPFCVLIWI